MCLTALLIDADAQRVSALCGVLASLGLAQPVVVGSLAAASKYLNSTNPDPDLVVAALDLPDGRALDVDLPWAQWPSMVFVMPGGEAQAAQAMRLGFSDYFIVDTEQGYLQIGRAHV